MKKQLKRIRDFFVSRQFLVGDDPGSLISFDQYETLRNGHNLTPDEIRSGKGTFLKYSEVRYLSAFIDGWTRARSGKNT